MRPPADSVAAFDSALGTVRLLGAALRGRDLPRLGQGRSAAAAVRASGVLPRPVRRSAYSRAGAGEGVPPEDLGDVHLDAVAGYVTEHYPQRRYPAVLIGAANGGLTHLAAAAQVPWLPQTVLVPVRWAGNEPDRPDRAMDWGRHAAVPLLRRNPGVELHHMHDGNQDELMVSAMAYFRCKWTTLPPAYADFLDRRLQPEAPVVLVRSTLSWPVRRVDARHVFQHGAYGGMAPSDYARAPHAPANDTHAAEAEWGTTEVFEEAVRGWAAAHGHPVVCIESDDPQQLALRAATVALEWRRRLVAQRPVLIVDQFIQSQPWQTLRTGASSLWTVFPVKRCASAAEDWIRDHGPFAQVHVALFNHGVASTGLADIERWRAISRSGDRPGRLLGQRPAQFPADFAALVRASSALRRLPDGPPWPLLDVRAITGLAAD